MQSPFNDLLQKEMDRKDFLKHLAVGVVAITGASTIVKTLTPAFSGNNGNSQPVKSMGYGASAYGGSANVAVKTRRIVQ